MKKKHYTTYSYGSTYEEIAPQTEKRGQLKKRKNQSQQTIFVVILVAVLLIVAMVGFYFYNLRPVSDSEIEVQVTVPQGATIEEVSTLLAEKGLIRSASVFESYAGHHSTSDKQIQAATYVFTPSMSSQEIFKKMVDGDSLVGTVMIPEGKNIKEMAAILEAAEICSASDFIAETEKLSDYKKKYSILSSIPDNADRTLEGYLFPDTYSIAPGSSAEEVVNTMLARFEEVYGEELMVDSQKSGKTVDEIVIMGSIIELETQWQEDKANCASVFYNRIAAGMPLQSDITVDYALGSKHDVLTTEQTQIDSPYNTYINLGLPIGPICSPSVTSMDAAIHPASTNYYYFVADMDTGKLHFNETLEGHNADVEKYM